MDRPEATTLTSSVDLLRWYWTRRELAELARTRGVPGGGSKADLLARVAADLDSRSAPHLSAPRQRVAAAPLGGDLTFETVIPLGQRCSQVLRAFFVAHVGGGFHFDVHMREFIGAEPGRTLGDAVAHWQATRACPAREIGRQFELNRFLRVWHQAHPGADFSAAMDAWRAHRARPRDQPLAEDAAALPSREGEQGQPARRSGRSSEWTTTSEETALVRQT